VRVHAQKYSALNPECCWPVHDELAAFTADPVREILPGFAAPEAHEHAFQNDALAETARDGAAVAGDRARVARRSAEIMGDLAQVRRDLAEAAGDHPEVGDDLAEVVRNLVEVVGEFAEVVGD
jgi:hypothetical protein